MKIDQYCQRQRCKHVELEQFLECFRVARVCQRQLGFLVLLSRSEAITPSALFCPYSYKAVSWNDRIFQRYIHSEFSKMACLDLVQPQYINWIRRPKNHTLEPNMKWIGWPPVAEIIFMAIRLFLRWRPVSVFDQTGNYAIQPTDTENPSLEPHTKSIGWPVAEIWPFKIFQDGGCHLGFDQTGNSAILSDDPENPVP